MKHPCEKCNKTEGHLFHPFEIESWETKTTILEKKDVYYLCLPCFDQLSEEAIQTEEISNRKASNLKHLQTAIEQGLACPLCNTAIFEEEHICPE